MHAPFVWASRVQKSFKDLGGNRQGADLVRVCGEVAEGKCEQEACVEALIGPKLDAQSLSRKLGLFARIKELVQMR